jgi:cardiolipin synthase
MWILSHGLAILGFLLALLLLSRVLHERRAPASTMAWLLAIALAPYIGVPLYLVLGGRKARRMAERKERLYRGSARAKDAGHALERILCAEGAPGALEGNRVGLLATGEAAFEALMRTLEGAERSIHIATFILGSDEVGDAVLALLERKAAAGLEVRLLIDAFFALRSNRRRIGALERAGGRCAFFMPVLHLPFRGHANLRNHRKIVVVDGERAIVGGMNLALEYMGPRADARRWCDVSMLVEGPAVGQIASIFRSDWAFAARETLLADGLRRPIAPPGAAGIQVVASGPDVPGDTLYDAMLTALFAAKERVWIATPYFIPDEALARALVLAVRRGVDVRVLVPERSNHAMADLAGGRYLREIQAAGGRVCPYLPGMMHAKVTVIDDAVGVLGSANMDMRSLFLDYEIALFFYSKPEIATLAGWFEGLLARCGPRLADAGRARALAEDFGRLLGPLV